MLYALPERLKLHKFLRLSVRVFLNVADKAKLGLFKAYILTQADPLCGCEVLSSSCRRV